MRLALGYSAFIVAALCFAWDYKLGWDSTKWFTAGAVVIYGILNGGLTLWMQYVEKDVIYEGIAPSGESVTIATSTKKNVPIYNITITVKPKTGKAQTITLAEPFAGWFDDLGHFVAIPFQQVFATAVPAIGKLDPKRVKVSKESMGADAGMLDAVLAASSNDAGDAEGSRRRKA